MKINLKFISLISLILAAICACSLITVAYLTHNSNKIENKFVGGTVGAEIEEDVTTTPGVKTDVKLTNDGTIDAYMRAYVSVNWVNDKDGTIYGTAPVEGVDYKVEKPEKFDFVENGGAYYCKNIVKAGETSPVLFTKVYPVEGKAPAGYSLTVEILSSSIQAKPETAVENAWGVTVTDGVITK